MRNWAITAEPRDETYRTLIRTAVARGAVGGLVANFTSWDAPFAKFMSELVPHTLSVEETFEWPGTVVGGGNDGNKGPRDEWPRLHKFSLNQDVVHLLTSYAFGLYDWLHPRLPEDLCFFDQAGRVWMTSTSHERDAYLTLAETELRNLLVLVPSLVGTRGKEEEA